ncbi:MAG: Bug family tripartite tricarboxylate transporter substrate binding protein [Bauldia sp.]
MRYIRLAVAIVAAALALGPATAQAPFSLEGRTIRFVVAQAAGSATDTEVRLMTRYFAKYLPGNPELVVQNLPGANGIRALEFVANLDPVRDLVVGATSSTIPFQARIGALDGVFDPLVANWVGTYTRSGSVCIAGANSGITSIDDLRTRDVTFGTQSASGSSYAIYMILKRAFGLRINVVVGYESLAATTLAVTRGELDGLCGPSTSLAAVIQPVVDSGAARFILYNYPVQRPEIPAPWLLDQPVVAGEEAFLQATLTAIGSNRPLYIPAGADPAFVALLRTAFDAILIDPDFIAEATALGIDVHYGSPATIEEMVRNLYATPDALIEEIRAFLYDG